ncbi:MAG: hypothetical protein V3U28_06700 [Candidatus Acidoferrales bacterium]
MSVTAVQFDIEGLIEIQQGMVRRREYRPLGLLEKVQFEKSAVAKLENNPLVKAKDRSASLDWYTEGRHGTLVGISNDEQELLLIGPLRPPPAIPDPGWTPPINWAHEAAMDAQGRPIPPVPPKVEQKLENFAYGKLVTKGEEWLVLQPIHQILVVLREGGWGDIACQPDHSGRHTALLYNLRRMQGHFLFGFHQVDVHPL